MSSASGTSTEFATYYVQNTYLDWNIRLHLIYTRNDSKCAFCLSCTYSGDGNNNSERLISSRVKKNGKLVFLESWQNMKWWTLFSKVKVNPWQTQTVRNHFLLHFPVAKERKKRKKRDNKERQTKEEDFNDVHETILPIDERTVRQ
jgi:hypothetical protein